MNQSYLAFSPVNTTAAINWSALSPNCLSFYRWVWRWDSQTGDVSPRTLYLAWKQGRHKATIYRWLDQLEALGVLKRDNAGTKDRVIVPLVEPPPRTAKNRVPRTQNATLNATLNATQPSYRDSYANTQVRNNKPCVESPSKSIAGGTQPEPERQEAPGTEASALVALGVAKPVAAALVAGNPEETREQLAALPFRAARDKAAVLVASIKESWPVPSAYKAAVLAKQKAAADAQNRALRAALEQKRESTRQNAKTAFSALPGDLRADLLARAAADLRETLPDVWRMMEKRSAETREIWVTNAALKLYECSVLNTDKKTLSVPRPPENA